MGWGDVAPWSPAGLSLSWTDEIDRCVLLKPENWEVSGNQSKMPEQNAQGESFGKESSGVQAAPGSVVKAADRFCPGSQRSMNSAEMDPADAHATQAPPSPWLTVPSVRQRDQAHRF